MRPASDLVDHLVRTTPLSPAHAQRVLDDLLELTDERVEEYVVRRHRELQRAGLQNAEIFARLSAELPALRFPAPDLTPRQLRRVVYG